MRLPFTLAVLRLPGSPDLLRKAFDLQRYGTWRELQFQIDTPIRSTDTGNHCVPSGSRDSWTRCSCRPSPPLPAPLATTYILTGPDGGPTGVTSDTFVVQLDGAVDSAVTVTPVDTGPGASGIFTPTSIALTTGVPGCIYVFACRIDGSQDNQHHQ